LEIRKGERIKITNPN